MVKAAELLFKANEAQKPTVLLMIDRNELEDQMLKNLAASGVSGADADIFMKPKRSSRFQRNKGSSVVDRP